MNVRRDGEETRHKILEAACHTFGEKGYRDATHAEICSRAGVNIAAINYHFRTKASLYQAAWDHTVNKIEQAYPLDGGVPNNAPAEEKLRAFIAALIGRITDEEMGYFHRIHMAEFFKPTGLLDEAFSQHLDTKRKRLHAIIRELLGPKAIRRDIEMCELSIVSQIRMVRPKSHRKAHPPLWHFTRKDSECLIDHITRFSLAGTEAIGREIEAREG